MLNCHLSAAGSAASAVAAVRQAAAAIADARARMVYPPSLDELPHLSDRLPKRIGSHAPSLLRYSEHRRYLPPGIAVPRLLIAVVEQGVHVGLIELAWMRRREIT